MEALGAAGSSASTASADQAAITEGEAVDDLSTLNAELTNLDAHLLDVESEGGEEDDEDPFPP